MGTRENNITKQAALYEIRDRGLLKGACREYIYRVCYLGEEYSGTIFNESDRIMSYICRAYNITEYGSRSNRIKSALRINKYTQNPYFEEAFNQIFRDYPNGIPNDYPKFRELLDENIERLASGRQVQNKSSKSTSSSDLDTDSVALGIACIALIIFTIFLVKTGIFSIIFTILKWGIGIVWTIVKLIFYILSSILGFLFGIILG